jgi:precorrin-3B synthase
MNTVAPKGWCPTLTQPMSSGDGLLVRIKPPGAVVPATAARVLARAAAQDGNGTIELTSRASLQVRGIRAETWPRFVAAMVAARLAHGDPEVEHRRGVIASPLAGDDPGVSRHAAVVAAELEVMLAREKRLAVLPSKFGFLVDGSGVLPVRAAPADIRVTLDGDACWVTADGAETGVGCEPADAAAVVARMALDFIDYPAGLPRRMRDLAGPRARPVAVPNAIGWLPYGSLGRGAFGVGLPFGVVDPTTLAVLADLSERFGDGTLRVTPWRALAILGVTEPHALGKAIAALGLIATPTDPRVRMFACPGQPACTSATVATRAVALQLVELGFAGTLHVAGCAKGCAHPTPADVTLVGEAGRYDVVLNGRPTDAPTWRGATVREVADLLRGIAA